MPWSNWSICIRRSANWQDCRSTPVHRGESFAANVRDPVAAGQEIAISQYPKAGYMGYTIRTKTHRYTEWRPVNATDEDAAFRELYAYGSDGVERVNLADRPEHHAVQETLKQRLDQAIASATGATPASAKR
ncbi:hypothetical protein Mal15_43130 [Stieleria maiorica]|uniref:Iduronate-2-sulfatase n=1 Tax=Stieleria maiorica TaxID=2795974 RepID=A0A5B9MG50_9BACT|nr:hypothetical protein [Stieleria maiorica]QEG00243.1 hypothetical protein Mal15_43130 [Stieleria maiorica]